MNANSTAFFARIAAALERLAPPPLESVTALTDPAYRWDGNRLSAVKNLTTLPASLITGVDRQKKELAQMLTRHAEGLPAHDVLLWGARGTGKSALVKALTAELQIHGKAIAIIECASDALRTLPKLFSIIGPLNRRYIIFIDDIAYEGAAEEARIIRSMLDGGVVARPSNIRLIVTSNRRSIIARHNNERGDALNPRDDEEDTLALADRFGLKLGFQRVDQGAYLAMVANYAAHFDLPYDEADALQFAHQRGGQSGRIAWHYTVEVAGKEGKPLDY